MARRRTPKWLTAARTGDWSAKRPEDKPQWLSRALARAGVLQPGEVETAIRGGRARLNGKVVREPMTFVRPGDRVELDGRAVALEAPTLVIAFHKPAGCVVSAVDQEGGGTVFERLERALPAELRRYRWHAVGRLDRGTTGLLLFTNDERFVEHATRPETHLPKRYVAHVYGELTEEKLEPLRRGVELDDGPTRPAKARVREPGVVELTIQEGRNHQVKRMLGALGLPVHQLHREAIGKLVLDVAVGEWRRLSADEVCDALGFSPTSSEVEHEKTR